MNLGSIEEEGEGALEFASSVRGSEFYVSLVFVVVCVSLLGLLGLWGAAFPPFSVALDEVAPAAAIAATVLVGSCGLALTLLQSLLERQAARRKDGILAWKRAWAEAESSGRPPRMPLSLAAAEGFLAHIETVEDPAARLRLETLGREAGIGTFVAIRLRRGDRLVVADALELLSRLRLPETFPSLLEAMGHASGWVRCFALRAAARTLSALPPEEREEGERRFLQVASEKGMDAGLLEEAILLAGEESARRLALRLLADRDDAPSLCLALAVIRRLRLDELAEEVVRFAHHPDTEVRSSALKALAALEPRPSEVGREAILREMESEHPHLRAHACRAAPWLPRESAVPALWERLADRSWWVRLAAAETLGAMAPYRLAEAVERHPDAFARDVASVVSGVGP